VPQDGSPSAFSRALPRAAVVKPYTSAVSPQVTRITLDVPSSEARPQARPQPTPRWLGRLAWVVAPVLLLAVGAAFVLLRTQPAAFFTTVLVVVFLAPFAWGLVSVLFPAYADRKCPECGELSVEALSEEDLHGVHCTACGYVDRDASAWKFAEERDQPLEPFVLESRLARAAKPETTT